jgi:CBS domain containing-hemolysin-like protein
VVVAHRLAVKASEKGMALLLRTVRPVVFPAVQMLIRWRRSPAIPPSEDEEEEASDREIQAFLDVGQAAGIIEGEEGEILESLVEFFDTKVREVMTPRTEMVALADTATYEELLETFARTHKSRIPVYRNTIDRVVGVVHVKNLVKDLLSGNRSPVTDLYHECLEVPEGKELGALLRDFQHGHQQMAIVVDEYGGTAGLVTLEDILEEIVGEIQDEHDPKQPPEWQELSAGVYRLRGRAPLEVLEEVLALEVVEQGIDTVGGLVFSRHGTVPEPGTVVMDEVHGLQFTVEEMKDRRILTVTVQRVQQQPQGEEN